MRTCVGCRRVAPAGELIRVTLGDPKTLLRLGRTAPGRGAWLCAGSPSCLDQALRRRGFDRALRTSITPEAVADLRAQLEAESATGKINFVSPQPGARD